MPRLHILQSIWGMDRLRGTDREWSMPERLQMIRDAGFDGICTQFHNRTDVATWIDQARDYGFVIEGQAFPTSVDDLRQALELAAEHQIHHLTVQADVRPYDVEASVPILAGWHRLGKEYGVKVLIETHRGMMTTDLWSTRQMLDQIPVLPLLVDLSHYVVGQEITLPVSPRNQAMVDRILAHAQGFHGRVASSGQVQVEIGFPCHQAALAQFLAWWTRGFRMWVAQAGPKDSLTFACELGPRPYAISGPDGVDLSDRWEDAKRLRGLVADVWSQVTADMAACRHEFDIAAGHAGQHSELPVPN
jgi:hypothetical protein